MDPLKLTVPELSLVVLVGPSGCGKSTFARKHFRPTEVISSDYCRAIVSDDEGCQEASADAFEILHAIAAKRLARAKLTVVDATNVQVESRKPLVELARAYHALPVAIVFDLPERLCQERNRERADRAFGPHVVRQQRQQMRRSLSRMRHEGFRYIHVLTTVEEADAAVIERTPLWCNRKGEKGPFDIVGDVHGCYDELTALLAGLGYEVAPPGDGDPAGGFRLRHPAGRRLIFLGDLTDRGPRSVDVLRLVLDAVGSGAALAVPGNHDAKLLRKLKGEDVRASRALQQTLADLAATPPAFQERVRAFLDGLVSHYVLDEGRLVVAHAGMTEEMQGRGSGRVRDFALFGETTGEVDEFGLPVRLNWAADYRGRAMVVYGHTPVPEAEWLNRTINIDTGCVFGGKLSALRYPEREIVSVPAARTYFESARPFLPPAAVEARRLTAQQMADDLLDIEDVLGKRVVATRLAGSVTVREEQAAAALEALSRFAVDPRWLIYLPPTMAPVDTSQEPGLLEHPAEAFAYYREHGIERVVCEEKHMGSRAIAIVCRDEATVRRRFGVVEEELGVIFTRTGRRFFESRETEGVLLARMAEAAGAAGLWDALSTDWLCLDCEIMPWSAKARALLEQQYAAVGAASAAALPRVVDLLRRAAAEGRGDVDLARRFERRLEDAERFVTAYRRYCWPVASVSDLKVAPFHLLASEGKVHVERDHAWHLDTLTGLAQAAPDVVAVTPRREVALADEGSLAGGVRWWEEVVGRGGEGMVVKPWQFVARGPRGLVQPALKCRGREYLRIIYGPDYTDPCHLDRLKARGLGIKRSLALREFALGVEGLERFVRAEPLRRVHECAAAVLALESEPVDPRL